MGQVGQSGDIQIRVRYAECDPMGVLHHAKFLEYFEMGRTELLRRTGVPYREWEARGYYFVVAKIACQYRAPARYDDVLTLTTAVDRITRARIDHSYRITRDGTLICEATSTLACVNRQGQLIAMPERLNLSPAGIPRDPHRAARGDLSDLRRSDSAR